MPFNFILWINLRPWTFRRHRIHQNSSINNIYIHKIKKIKLKKLIKLSDKQPNSMHEENVKSVSDEEIVQREKVEILRLKLALENG